MKNNQILLKPRSVGRMNEFLHNVKRLLEDGEEITVIGDNLTMGKIIDFCQFPIEYSNPLKKGKPIQNTFKIRKK